MFKGAALAGAVDVMTEEREGVASSLGSAPPAPGGGPGVSVAVVALLVVALVVGVLVGSARRAQRAQPALTGAQPGVAQPGITADADATAIGDKVSAAVVDITGSVAGGTAAGTGMIITSSGEVLTNNHVIQGATNIRAQINGSGPTYSAKVLGYDAADDVALLQLQNVSHLKTVTVGNSSGVTVGEPVVAIGNAGGQPGPLTVTQGSITALNRILTAADPGGRAETLTGMIQVNARIEPGDSGGPLVNSKGTVVGMNTAAARGFRMSASNVGFAVPISTAMAVVHQIEGHQASSTVHVGPRGMLGVQVADGYTGAYGGFSGPQGASVAGVQADGPAEGAGLAAGDTIVSLNGTPIGSATDLTDALDPSHPGDKVVVGWVDRSGQRHSAPVTLASGTAG